MHEEQIQMLIDSIEYYDEERDIPWYILLYIDGGEELEDFYFAAMAALKIPAEDEIDDLMYMTKEQVGNMVYAADYLIMKKEEAIEHLESLID